MDSQDDYDGYRFIVITPTQDTSGSAPDYLVSGKTGQIDLTSIVGDDAVSLCQFGSMDSLVQTLLADAPRAERHGAAA